MNKYQITTEKKKSAIRLAAIQCFKEKGFGSTTMHSIAKASDVSLASIYNYFGSKEALLIDCVKEMLSTLSTKGNQILHEEIPFEDKVKKALGLCSEDFNQIIKALITKENSIDDKFKQLIFSAITTENNRLYRQFIEFGRQTGELDSSIPVDIYLLFIESLNQMGTKIENQLTLKQNSRAVQKLFLHGLLGTKQNPSKEPTQ